MLIRQAVSAAEASMHKGIKNKAQVTSMSMPCLEALLGLMPPLAVLDYVFNVMAFQREAIPPRTKRQVVDAAGGKCSKCGIELRGDRHIDHIVPVSAGGTSHASNLQTLCPPCNLSKGASLPKPLLSSRPPLGPLAEGLPELREWQGKAIATYFKDSPEDFLIEACPGSGKTFACSMLARQIMERNGCQQVIVVCPSVHLKRQWRNALSNVGITVYEDVPNSNHTKAERHHGACITYSQLKEAAASWAQLAGRTSTLVIFDEVHHGGEETSWGQAATDAFGCAAARVCLSGTPFRSDSKPIPFIEYDQQGKCLPGYRYSYRDAVAEDVCRPVHFNLLDGKVKWAWQDNEGTLFDTPYEKQMSDNTVDDETASRRLKAAVSCSETADGFLEDMLEKATIALAGIRKRSPSMAGLVLASDVNQARKIKQHLEGLGEKVELVVSADEAAADNLKGFSTSDHSWVVAIKMISEGVDIPRLGVMVYASVFCQELFFRQAVGRVIRISDIDPPGFQAQVFLPDDRRLRGMASRMEEESQHRTGEQQQTADLPSSAGERRRFEITPLSGEVTDSQVVYAGYSFSEEQIMDTASRLEQVGLNHQREDALAVLARENKHQAEVRHLAPGAEHPEDLERRLRKDLDRQEKRNAQALHIVRLSPYQDCIKQVRMMTRREIGDRKHASPEAIEGHIVSLQTLEDILRQTHGFEEGFPEPLSSAARPKPFQPRL